MIIFFFNLFQIKIHLLHLRSKRNQEKIIFTFLVTFTPLQMSNTNDILKMLFTFINMQLFPVQYQEPLESPRENDT